jgi:hypothetical protein
MATTPRGWDLAGQYFWWEGAREKAEQVIRANSRLAHLSWLNLRTWKRAIPRLGIERPITAEVQAMLKVYPGTKPGEDHFSFKALDACLASPGWQRTRLDQLERLADTGFKVIQIDELPIPSLWHLTLARRRSTCTGPATSSTSGSTSMPSWSGWPAAPARGAWS